MKKENPQSLASQTPIAKFRVTSCLFPAACRKLFLNHSAQDATLLRYLVEVFFNKYFQFLLSVRSRYKGSVPGLIDCPTLPGYFVISCLSTSLSTSARVHAFRSPSHANQRRIVHLEKQALVICHGGRSSAAGSASVAVV